MKSENVLGLGKKDVSSIILCLKSIKKLLKISHNNSSTKSFLIFEGMSSGMLYVSYKAVSCIKLYVYFISGPTGSFDTSLWYWKTPCVSDPDLIDHNPQILGSFLREGKSLGVVEGVEAWESSKG